MWVAGSLAVATERSSIKNIRLMQEVLMPGGVKTEVRTYQLYINGEWVDSKSNKTFPVYDPSTEEVIAQAPDANADDVNRAVAAAKAAFEDGPWATTTAQERGRVLFRLAEKIRQNTADAGRARIPQHRQAHRRSGIRHRRRRDLLRVLRRPGHKNSRIRKSGSRQRHEPHAARSRSASPARSFPGTIRC